MEYITKQELIDKLLDIKGNTFVTASVDTSVRLKGGNPWGGKVRQKQNLNGAIGFVYLNSINRQEDKHGTAITEAVKPRAWGTPSENNVLVDHTLKNGEAKKYLQMKVESRPNEKSAYYYNAETGEEIPKEQVYQWKYDSKRSSTQANLPEDVEIIVRDIDLNNIEEIKIGGQHYRLCE